MTQLQPEQLEILISAFDIEASSSDRLASAWKVAKTQQDNYRPNTPQFKKLETFKSKLMKQIRVLRKGPSIEELDAQAEAHNAELEAAQQLLKDR